MKEEYIIAALIAIFAGGAAAYLVEKKLTSDSGVAAATLETRVQSMEVELKKYTQAQANVIPALRQDASVAQMCQALGGTFDKDHCGLPYATVEQLAMAKGSRSGSTDHRADSGGSGGATEFSPTNPVQGIGIEIYNSKRNRTSCVVEMGQGTCKEVANGKEFICLVGKKSLRSSVNTAHGHVKRKYDCRVK